MPIMYDKPKNVKFGGGGCDDSSIHPPQFCLGQQHCRWNSEIRNNTNMTIRGSYPELTNCCHTEDMDYLPHAVCNDCVYLMPLIWLTMPLSSDGDGAVNRTGHRDIGIMTVPQLDY